MLVLRFRPSVPREVMEYATNGELFDHIVHKLKLPEDEAGLQD